VTSFADVPVASEHSLKHSSSVLHVGVSPVLRLFSAFMSRYISEHGVLFRTMFTFLLLRGS